MFCRNCGKEIADSAEICIHYECKNFYRSKFCNSWGIENLPEAEICVKYGMGLRKNTTNVSDKSRLATVLLAWFVGHSGIHRFYIGKTGKRSGNVYLMSFGMVNWYGFN